jgi:ABC-2 type transport system ATP-binding protein
VHAVATERAAAPALGREVPVALAVESLTKAFGGVRAVDDVSLSVHRGEIVGLLGPNGAGKSTTISCLAGLMRPDGGRVRICGIDALSDGRRARRHLGLATQRSALYPLLDVRTNLRFYAQLLGALPEDVDDHVEAAIETLDLQPLLSRPVAQLSIGQQRIVHIASALVGRPQVLLLDEATAYLDVSARRLVLDAVRRLAADGTAVLYSSHYLAEVEDLCERVVMLHKGRTLADGEIAALAQAHGGGRVEMVVEGKVLVHHGDDLQAALRTVGTLERIESVRVIKPSLETVFLTLTGERIDAEGFVSRDRHAA